MKDRKLENAFPSYYVYSTGGGFYSASKEFKGLNGKMIEVQLHENGVNVYALTDDLSPTEFASTAEYEGDELVHDNWIELHSMSGWHDDLAVEPMFDEETLATILAESKKFLRIFWGDAEYYRMFPKEKKCERCGTSDTTESQIETYDHIEINYEEGIVLNFGNSKQLCFDCFEEIETEVFTSINEPRG